MTSTSRGRARITGALGALVAGTLALTLTGAPADAAVRQTAATNDAAPQDLRAAATVLVYQPLVISGKVKGKKRKLLVQEKFGGTWVKAGKGKTNKKGRFSVAVPTDVYGKHKVRVVAPRAKGKRAVTGKTKKYTVVPLYTPVGSPSSYTLYSPGNDTRWNSCTPITWAYNSGGTDAAHRAVVDVAIAEAQRATGWRFKYVGETTKVPFTYNVKGVKSEPANIIIAWSTPATLPILAGSVAGYGGSTYGLRKRGSRQGEVIAGGVTLDASDSALGQFTEYGNGISFSWGAIVRHELGHVIGLDHTGDASQIMYYAAMGTNEYYGAGDLHGIDLATKSRGCGTKPLRKQLGVGGKKRDVTPQQLRTLGLVPFQGSGPLP